MTFYRNVFTGCLVILCSYSLCSAEELYGVEREYEQKQVFAPEPVWISPSIAPIPTPVMDVPEWESARSTQLTRSISSPAALALAREEVEWKKSQWSEGESGILSMNKQYLLQFGGEVALDYIFHYRDAPNKSGQHVSVSRWDASLFNLRLTGENEYGIRFQMKLDLSPDELYTQDTLVEECRAVFENICGSRWSVALGKGEVPYGQDRTLGVIQSYHHNANRATSKEGPLLLLYNDDKDNDPKSRNPWLESPGKYTHPGEIDRVWHISGAYEWDNVARVEAAVFQMDRRIYGRNPSDWGEGIALRGWWNISEQWTAQLSLVRLMSRVDRNLPLHRDNSYALSMGVDGRGERWEAFAEWEHSWDWNGIDGEHTDTFQLGGAWHWTENWRVGGMIEWLRRRSPVDSASENWARGVLNIQYEWDSGLFALAEYGHEWFNGHYASGKNHAHGGLFAMRLGWRF